MYGIPFGTSPISGKPRFITCAPRLHWRWSNPQWDEHGQLVVGYSGSTSFQSDDCASHVHLTGLSWSIFWVTSIFAPCISRLVTFKKICAAQLNSADAFVSGWAHVPRKVPKTLTKHGIPPLELCCLNLGILTSLALAWNGLVQMNSSNNVTLLWLPGLGIIWSKLCLLQSHFAEVRIVNFLKVGWWSIQLFDYSITQETTRFTWSFWRTLILMLFTL